MPKPQHLKDHYIECISQFDFLSPEKKSRYVSIIKAQSIPDDEKTRDMVLAKLLWICEKNLQQSANDHNKKLLDQFATNVGYENMGNIQPRKSYKQSGNN